jgi:hypothetical protein
VRGKRGVRRGSSMRLRTERLTESGAWSAEPSSCPAVFTFSGLNSVARTGSMPLVLTEKRA